MPSILITGASGFIGSYLVEHGLESGYQVWAAMRKSSSRQYLQDPRTAFITLDLGDDEALRQQLEAHVRQHGAFDYCIHAAGATKCPSPEDFSRTNTEGTLRLYRLLHETGALRGRFVFISSLSVMGAVADNDLTHRICETDTPAPNTAYGISKLDAERGLATMGGDYIILRPTGVYGPRERDYFLMAKSIKQHTDFAVGYSRQVITFIYMRDLVSAAYLALDRGQRGGAYFLSDGKEYDSRAFSDLLQREIGTRFVLHITAPLWVLRGVCWVAERLNRLTGKTSALNSDKYNILSQRNWKCDITPAQRDLGFKPEWNLDRGVTEAVAWYKANGWL